MNFVSAEYFVLLSIAVLTVRFLPHRWSVRVLLLLSFIFYGWDNPAYLPILLFLGLIGYVGGLAIDRHRTPGVLWALILLSLSSLLYFKYLGFFTRVLSDLSGIALSRPPEFSVHALVLPIGISFFTFQAISYIVDVYWRDVAPERSPTMFMLFKAFFPQLVAGPIERAGHLIPQLKQLGTDDRREQDLALGGFLILKGIFLKIVIADNLAVFVNSFYGDIAARSPLDALLATYFFSIQIYADFYGYTLLALGSARLLGIDLISNFAHPYFAENIQQFWRRWHITLTTWFRDYVYIPLGGNRGAPARTVFNIALVMLLVALWHGANYTFIVWGAGHAALLALYHLYQIGRSRIAPDQARRSAGLFVRGISLLVTFHLVTFLWIFFRAPSVEAAGQVILKLWSGMVPGSSDAVTAMPYTGFYLFITALFIVFAVLDRATNMEARLKAASLPLQAAAIAAILLLTYAAPFDAIQFIYFQF